jgi:hypothetical protein
MKLPALFTFVLAAGLSSISSAISRGFSAAQFLSSTQIFKTFAHLRFHFSFTRIYLQTSFLSVNSAGDGNGRKRKL